MGSPSCAAKFWRWDIADDALAQAESRGFVVDRQQTIAAADIRLVVLKAPADLSTQKALRELRDADPKGVYDYNHIYSGGGAVSADRAPTEPEQNTLPSELVRPHIRVGLLDTGIDVTHPVFHDSLLHTWGCGDRRFPSAHGTAVASLLVAHASAELYAADVYCDAPTGGAVDAIVAAFGWMAQEQVSVINVSLVGPKNILLERVVNALLARGHVLVAAVGNDGPAAPPLYPAAYDGRRRCDSCRCAAARAHRGGAWATGECSPHWVPTSKRRISIMGYSERARHFICRTHGGGAAGRPTARPRQRRRSSSHRAARETSHRFGSCRQGFYIWLRFGGCRGQLAISSWKKSSGPVVSRGEGRGMAAIKQEHDDECENRS